MTLQQIADEELLIWQHTRRQPPAIRLALIEQITGRISPAIAMADKFEFTLDAVRQAMREVL